MFLDLVRQERPDLIIPEVVWTKGGVVSCKPAVQGTEKVLNYLGRYIHRIALTNLRLLAIDNGQVGFRSQASQDQRWKTMTWPAHEFIRRLLPQVLPQGFPTVRYDGLGSPSHRPLLHHLQLWLAGQPLSSAPASPEHESPPQTRVSPPLQAGQPCPHGGQGLLIVIRLLPRLQRGPP
jgi:Putative transposase